MITAINPKLPMRNKIITRNYYLNMLEFSDIGSEDFQSYLIIKKDQIEIHFFEFKDLNPAENYGQIYIRTNDIKNLYQHYIKKGVIIHPADPLRLKPWGQMEFSVLDPDHNLLTFGQSM